MKSQLSDVFESIFSCELPADKPAVITVSHAGNWKALYPTIRERFADVAFHTGIRVPVLLGETALHYLKHSGPLGAIQFKRQAQRLLERNDRIVVFEAQKIECLRTNPQCVRELLTPGRAAALFFREGIDPAISKFLHSLKNDIVCHPRTICPSSLSVLATQLSTGIINDEFRRVAAIVTEHEKQTLGLIQHDVMEALAPEVEDCFLEGSFGVPRLREVARRKIATALLRETVPAYSVKSGQDPIAFFHEFLSEKFARHELPVGSISEVSPNLSFVVKSQRRFSELHAA